MAWKNNKNRLGQRVAVIRANDEPGGGKIYLGINRATYDGKPNGYRVAASNGDDVGHYAPQSKLKCLQDIEASYRGWQTLEWLPAAEKILINATTPPPGAKPAPGGRKNEEKKNEN